MEKQNQDWELVEPGVWKPENAGDEIVGVLVNVEPADDAANIGARYYLENTQGRFFIWGTAVLDDRMKYVKIGQLVKIVFQGKVNNKRGQTVNMFKVYTGKSSDAPAPAEDSASSKGIATLDDL